MHTSSTSMQTRVDQTLSSLITAEKFSNALMACIADELGFTKVYTTPYSPHLNSVIE